MATNASRRLRKGLAVWAVVIVAMVAPIAFATTSPLLAWRDPIYIASGFAGIAALSLLLLQPMLAAGLLPGPSLYRARRLHRIVGIALILSVCAHVFGLWITSPPDVVDALLFMSPTPFSAWGVIAMWAMFLAAAVALLRRRIRLGPKAWRRLHIALAAIVVIGSVVHALRVEGTMESVSKIALCLGVCVTAILSIRRLA